MRALHLTRDFPPRSTGGLSTAVGSLVTALRTAGVATDVISFDHWRPRSGGSTQFETGAGAALRVRAGSPIDAIEATARRFRPSVIHLHHENLWPFADVLRARLHCPIVYTVHILQPSRTLGGTTARSRGDQAAAVQGCDLVAAPSHFAAAAVREAYAPPTLVRLLPNIVEAADLHAPRTGGDRRVDPPRVVYAGRFDLAKGFDVLFEIMCEALAAEPTLHFDIAGGLPANRKGERRWLARWNRTAPPDTAGRVHFHGWIERDRLSAIYSRASAQIVPSRCETFGLSAAEGMAHGLPVVAARAGALPELIADGDTGWLAPEGDGRAIAARISEILADPRRAREIGRRAARSVRCRFNSAAVVAEVLGAYTSVG